MFLYRNDFLYLAVCDELIALTKRDDVCERHIAQATLTTATLRCVALALLSSSINAPQRRTKAHSALSTSTRSLIDALSQARTAIAGSIVQLVAAVVALGARITNAVAPPANDDQLAAMITSVESMRILIPCSFIIRLLIFQAFPIYNFIFSVTSR